MNVRHIAARMGGALGIAVAIATSACAPESPAETSDQKENTAEAQQALFSNGDFETGNNGQAPPSWTVTTNSNPGITIQSPQTKAGLNLQPGGNPLTTILATAAGPESQTDPDLGNQASFRWPKYGNKCAIVNNHGNGQNVNTLSQTMTVGPGDVDPADGQVHIRAVVAPVLQNPSHNNNQQPYFFVQLTNLTKNNAVLYQDFNFSAQPGVPWKSQMVGGLPVFYTDWQLIDIAPGAGAIAQGDQVKLEIIAAGCSLGAHWGEVYVDGVGATIPGLFVSATGPHAANAGTDITYTLTYKNGSAVADTGVKVDFNMPPNTTFVSINAPGLSCTTPAVGMGGLSTCTIGNLAAGAFGSYQITVHIAPAATGTIVAGNYDIYGNGVSPLLGPKVVTIVGCQVDADCNAGNWCQEATPACVPKLPNGTAIPSDPPHMNPSLNGTCTAAAGALVCQSGVCDAADNKCGYANGDGSCNAGNAGTVCRSGVCDPDGKCGYANGDGPCTQANQGTVCRSGVCDPDGSCGYAVNDGPCTKQNQGVVCRSGSCSVNGLCQPDGGCNVDADCVGGKWCNESMHACTDKLANGVAIPSDPPHMGPTLDGTCTPAAATLVCASSVCDMADNACGYLNGDGTCDAGSASIVCRSGVCDPDTKCGYANGDGPCNAGNANVVCRSGACSANGNVCIPPGGCGSDADCSSDQWCNTQTFACTPKLPNGQMVPTVTGHTPPLVGMCTPAAGAAVCVSGVCDADNLCGYADGDGPCTMQNGSVVCRSGACSANGLCEPAGGCNIDADCMGGKWCNESAHQCSPQVANGGVMPVDGPHQSPTLDGTCTDLAAVLVCVSGVCDTADNKCGYANGDGSCTPANRGTVCRSSVCDPDGKCGYANGDGPCNLGNQGVVCRSGACSTYGDVCIPAGGCFVDQDCGPSEWCNTPTYTCQPKLPNGTDIPTVANHTPALTGMCTMAAGSAVCASGVCDPKDNKCGYANGDGPCTVATGSVVCRSGVCDAAGGVCKAAAMCNVDSDCNTATEYCNTEDHACVQKLPNGADMPTVAGHTPALDGKCNDQEAKVVCLSNVCDKDNKCGYANGDGPCTVDDAGTVCRSSTCSSNGGMCIPSGGCGVDADCASDQWCNTQSFTCTPKLLNGVDIPTVTGHTPNLDGTCTVDTGKSVCASGVCDTKDNKCGYALGDGPCTPQDGGVVCRSGACSAQDGVCVTPAPCNQDSDCDTTIQYCDTGVHLCAPKVPNGTLLPAVKNHSPNLDGTCTPDSAKIECISGVCDAADNKCGHAIGKGPCDSNNGSVVCRSGQCGTSGANKDLCVECNTDMQCQGSKPVCDTGTNECVQCTPAEMAACVGATPVCTTPVDKCGPCDGDFGSGTPAACSKQDNPYCFLTGPKKGECGKCMSDADCVGHGEGATCDQNSGACVMACHTDADCDATQWCNAPDGGTGMCTAKLDNGQHLPNSPTSVVKCTEAVGKRVCKSGVCDTKDDTCGYLNGDGPCADGSVCRSGACDTKDNLCGLKPGDGPCSTDAVCRTTKCDPAKMVCSENPGCKADADCPATDFCQLPDGYCRLKLPNGDPCTGATQCASGICDSGKCAPPEAIVAEGNGLFCSLRNAGDDRSRNSDVGAVLFGLALASGALLRRRRK
jgi:hypothetical protein